MGTPQPGIFALGTRSHHHLELDLVGQPDALLTALDLVREAVTTVAGVNLIVGFGPSLWARLAPHEVPEGLADFTPIEGVDGIVVPAEQHDVWLWLHAGGPDAVFRSARAAALALGEVAEVRAEQPSFSYLASQDLTGFEDGTENPPLEEALTAAVVPDGHPGAGGSVVLVQRWVHDLDAFEALPIPEREAVFGRTLVGSEELPDDVRPSSAHISRVVIEDDEGEELEVFRRSTAFGGVVEHGLEFVAFSADHARLHRMLTRMVGGEDGVHDRLLDFSRPTRSAWYVTPSLDALRSLTGAALR
jgi:putative iron-dependent peroxidase